MVVDETLVFDKTRQLYSSADVQNQREACVVLFHSYMLEYGFIPKNVSEKEMFLSMPKKWKEREIYKILYYHPCCKEYTCSLTCIPLYNTLSVLGVVCDSDCLESVNIKIDMLKYLKDTQNFSNLLEVFQDVKSLSIEFKDGFCLPLLNLLCTTAGCNPLFGLSGLLSEIKVHVMELLPVEDILSLASVNKEFYSLTNQPQLWKFLFLRDFANGGIPDIDIPPGDCWKQQYKKEYLKKKRRARVRFYYPFPVMDPRQEFYRIFPPHLDYEDNVELYFQPQRIPQLPPFFQRMPPNIPRMPPFYRRLN